MDAGLEKIVAAETVLSDVDGAQGRLIVRGLSLDDLAGRASFEDMVRLLWCGFFEDLPTAEALPQRLGTARAAAFARLAPHASLLRVLPPVEAMRVGLALLPDGDGIDVALGLVGGAAVCAALAGGQGAPVPPDPKADHAADLLRMMRGRLAEANEAKALGAYLVTVAEHGLNASTFAARVVASTQAGLGSAVIAGLCALKGPLHGGAPGPVLDMLDGIGSPENAAAWIEAAFARGERLMGFGHRVYRVRDPRADAVKAAALLLPQSTGRLALANAVERVALSELAERYPTRSLQTNVEFHTAVLLEALGVPRAAFTCLFGAARTAGWIAHAREQLATKRLIRPASVYVGPHAKEAA